MTRETYLQRTVRERQEKWVESQAYFTRWLKRIALGSFLVYGLPAISLSGVTWMFAVGAVLTAPTFLIWAEGGIRAFIPRQTKSHERIPTGHGFSVRAPDMLLQSILAAVFLSFFVMGYYLMLAPLIFS
jgi:hypothetical protein